MRNVGDLGMCLTNIRNDFVDDPIVNTTFSSISGHTINAVFSSMKMGSCITKKYPFQDFVTAYFTAGYPWLTILRPMWQPLLVLGPG